MKNTILITGATGGIGRALSIYLAGKGHSLILNARNLERLEALQAEIYAMGLSKPEILSLDLSSALDIQKCDLAKLGRIDGLVLMPPQLDPVADPFATSAQWQNFFSSSFIGPLAFIQAILPNLKQANRGKIVIISGISSLQVLSHYATSNVLRCAWLAQAKTLAHFLGKDSIHVNTLSLGGVLTDEYQKELEVDASSSGQTVEQILAKETANVPLHKYAKPIEIAYSVEALLGSFSDHITGVNIAVDGGFTRAY
jgi:3-oxoacyl-[acyl-carrier protein] reductase